MDAFELLGLGIYAWITIATVLTMFSVLLFTKLRTDLVFLGAIAFLYVTGVMSAEEAFSGFSNKSVIVVGVLFVVVAGLCFAGTCIMSIVHNRDSFGDAVLSILGKMFIILFTLWTIAIVAALLILYLLLSLVAHSPRDEYIVLKYDRYLDAFVGYRYYD